MKELPGVMIGGVGAGEWPRIDPEKYADELVRNGNNLVCLEAMAPAFAPQTASGWSGTPITSVAATLMDWVTVMASHGVFCLIHVINGNDDVDEQYTAKEVLALVDLLCNMDQIVKDHLILCMVAETNGRGFESNIEQAGEKIAIMANVRLAYNGTGRPRGAVGSRYSVIDYHTQDPHDLGPEVPGVKVILDTDNGPIINRLRANAPAGCYWNPESVTAFVDRAVQAGRGVNLYAFQYDGMDTVAMYRMGLAAGVLPEPAVDPIEPGPAPEPEPTPEPKEPVTLCVDMVVRNATGFFAGSVKYKEFSGVIEVHGVKVSDDQTQVELDVSGDLNVLNRRWVMKRTKVHAGLKRGENADNIAIQLILAGPTYISVDAVCQGRVEDMTFISGVTTIDTAGATSLLLDNVTCSFTGHQP